MAFAPMGAPVIQVDPEMVKTLAQMGRSGADQTSPLPAILPGVSVILPGMAVSKARKTPA